jgi:hypothetical protein
MTVTEGYPSQTQIEQPKDSPPIADAAETFIGPQHTVASFETGQGSVYTYSETGQTTRYKTATGEKMTPRDITVFVSLDIQQEQDVLAAYRTSDQLQKTKVYVVERQPNDRPKIIRKTDEVQYPEGLYLATFKDGVMAENIPATLFPQVGFNVFDTRHFQQDGTWKTERHLGNKVTKINYKESGLTPTV